MGKFLQSERNEGRDILLLADGNTTRDHQEFKDFFIKYDMYDIIPEGAPSTCSRSNPTSPPTEIAFGTGLFEAAIQSVGFYPFYHYTGSDHH